jgi:hypothetical protein
VYACIHADLPSRRALHPPLTGRGKAGQLQSLKVEIGADVTCLWAPGIEIATPRAPNCSMQCSCQRMDGGAMHPGGSYLGCHGQWPTRMIGTQ